MTQPTELRLRDGGRALEIDWDDARASRLTAHQLRAACRCAGCTRAAIDGRAGAIADTICVTGIDPVGGYAVNLTFSDGHARGIFPWILLREIADAGAISCSTGVDLDATVAADRAQRDEP